MNPDGECRQPVLLLKSLKMNPQRFKSFFSKYINERIASTGLTESQAVFLLNLNCKEGISLKELTDRVGVHKSLTTRMIKLLIEEGFIINTAESGKEYSVVLTKKGSSAQRIIDKAMSELFDMILEDLSDDEITLLYEILFKVRDKMERLSEDGTSVENDS